MSDSKNANKIDGTVNSINNSLFTTSNHKTPDELLAQCISKFPNQKYELTYAELKSIIRKAYNEGYSAGNQNALINNGGNISAPGNPITTPNVPYNPPCTPSDPWRYPNVIWAQYSEPSVADKLVKVPYYATTVDIASMSTSASEAILS